MRKSVLFFLSVIVVITAQAASPLFDKGNIFNTSYSEFQLEDSYMSTPYKISYTIEGGNDAISVEPEPSHMRSTTDEESRMEIYNEDMTLDKEIKISDLDPNGIRFVRIESVKQGDKHFYITQSLFNNDDLYEFIVLAKGYFAIVNENGDLIHKENLGEDFVSGADFSVFLFETSSSDNTYLFVEQVNPQWAYTTTVYRINKQDISGINSESQLTKVKYYPNPARDYMTVNYDLGTTLSGNITLTDLQGKVVLQKGIDNTNTSCNLLLNKFKSGVYVINVKAGDQLLSSERVIIK